MKQKILSLLGGALLISSYAMAQVTGVLSVNGPICEGENLQLSVVASNGSGNYSYSWTGPNGFSSTLQNPVINGATADDYGYYKVTITDNVSSDVFSKQIQGVVNLKPNLAVTSNSPFCAGGDLVLQGTGGMSYVWTGPNGFTSNFHSPIISNATAAASGTYHVTTSNGYCSAEATINVTIGGPTIAISSNTPVCEGSSLNLNATGGVSYSWTGPNGFTSTNSDPSISNATLAAAGTYTVTVTDANGCTDEATTVVAITPQPTATASTTKDTVCEDATIELFATGGTSYAWTGPNGFSSNAQNPTISNASGANSGTYSVTVSNGTCSANATVDVLVSLKPVLVTSSNSPVCEGGVLNLSTTGGMTYVWTGPNGYTSTVHSPIIDPATPAHSGRYHVTGSNPYCTVYDSVDVVVSALPTITVSSNSPVCEGTTVSLTANGGATYSWTGPNGFTSTDQNPDITSATLAASGNYLVTVTNADGCTDTASTDVVVAPLPSVSIIAPDTICEGTILELQATGGTTYSWTGPNGFTSTDQNPVINNVTMSNYGTYTVTVDAGSGCSNSASAEVVIWLKPNMILSSNSPICAGQDLFLGATGGMAHEWTGPNGFNITNEPAPIIANATPAATGWYFVTAYNPYCMDTGSIHVVVGQVVSVTAGSNGPICEGDTLFLNASAGDYYSWTGPNGFTSTEQNPFIDNASAASAGRYYVTVSDNAGCNGTDSVDVVIHASPVPTVSSNSPVCEGATINLTASGGVTYSWVGPNGFNSTDQNPVITDADANNAGIYSVTITSTEGCEGSANTAVVVNPLPNITVISNSPICETETISLRATGGVDYNWTGPNGFTSNVAGPDIANATVAASGWYYVTVTNIEGCSQDDSIEVVVNPKANVVASVANSPVCEGKSLELTATGGVGNYSWTGPNGFTSTDQNPVIPNVNMNHWGTYTVTSGIGSCAGSSQISVTINLKPNVVTNTNSPVCEGQTLFIGATGGMGHQWIGPNGFTANIATPILTKVSTAAAGAYRVVAFNAYGCTDTAIVNVVVNPGPTVSASANSPVYIGDTLNLSASGTGSSYSWTGPYNFLSSQQNPQIVDVKTRNSGTYTVTAYDAEGCSNEATVNVTVIDPNGSNSNASKPAANNNTQPQINLYPNPATSVVTIKSETAQPMATVVVYNTLGQVVYSGNAAGAISYQLSVANYVSGTYNVRVVMNNGTQLQSKFQVAK